MGRQKIIGIIGGMGPLASCDLYRKIIMNTEASCDSDHLHVIIDSNTKIPDRTDAILYHGKSPLPMLIESARKLEQMGAEIIIIACNTSHFFIDELRESIHCEVISIIEAVFEEVKRKKLQSISLFATEGTAKTGIYQRVFKEGNLKLRVSDDEEQRIVTDVIYNGIKEGNYEYDGTAFQNLIIKQSLEGEQAFILGCTELPIAVSLYHIKGNFIDPSLCLARAAIVRAGGEVIPENASFNVLVERGTEERWKIG